MLERVILLMAASGFGLEPLAIVDGSAVVSVTDAQANALLTEGTPFALIYWDRAMFDSRLGAEDTAFVAEVIRDRRDRFVAAPFSGATDWTASRLKLGLAFAARDNALAGMMNDVVAFAAHLLHGDAVEHLGAQGILDAVLVDDGGVLSTLATVRAHSALGVALAPVQPAPAIAAFARAQAELSTAMGYPAEPADDIPALSESMAWVKPGGADAKQLLTLLELPVTEWRGGLIVAVDPALAARLEEVGETVTPLHRLVVAYGVDEQALSAPEFERVLGALAAGEVTAQDPATRVAFGDALFSALTWRAAAVQAVGTKQPDLSALLGRQIKALGPFATQAFEVSEQDAVRALTARDSRHPLVAAISEARDTLVLIKAAASAERATAPAALDALIAEAAILQRRAEDLTRK